MKKKSSTKRKSANGIKPVVKRRIIRQHPHTKAWNEFTKTDNYKLLTNGETISLPKRCETYLANRIKTAFDKGWAEAEKYFA